VIRGPHENDLLASNRSTTITSQFSPLTFWPPGNKLEVFGSTTMGSHFGEVDCAPGNLDLATGMPALFIFASFDGTISGWNPANGTAAIEKVPRSADSILTGATIAQIGDQRFLYVADLKKGKIEGKNHGLRHNLYGGRTQ
jgi:hypothetical protein